MLKKFVEAKLGQTQETINKAMVGWIYKNVYTDKSYSFGAYKPGEGQTTLAIVAILIVSLLVYMVALCCLWLTRWNTRGEWLKATIHGATFVARLVARQKFIRVWGKVAQSLVAWNMYATCCAK